MLQRSVKTLCTQLRISAASIGLIKTWLVVDSLCISAATVGSIKTWLIVDSCRSAVVEVVVLVVVRVA